MTVQKVGGVWGYSVMLGGERHRKQSKHWTKRMAQIAEREVIEAHDRSGTARVTMNAAFELFLASSEHSGRTVEEYRGYWDKHISESLGSCYADEVGPTRIDDFVNSLPKTWKGSTANKRIKLVRRVLHFVWERGYIKYVPRVRAKQEIKNVVSWYSEEQRDLFLKTVFDLRPHWYCFFYFAMRLGLRRGELYAMVHEQIDVDRSLLIVDRTAEQGSKTRPVEIKPRKANQALSLWIPEDVISAYQWHCENGFAGRRWVFHQRRNLPTDLAGFRRAMSYCQGAAGLPKYGLHVISRHSVGSQAANQGSPMQGIQRQLGHSQLETTQRYAHLSDRLQRAVIDSLAPVNPPHSGDSREGSSGNELTEICQSVQPKRRKGRP